MRIPKLAITLFIAVLCSTMFASQPAQMIVCLIKAPPIGSSTEWTLVCIGGTPYFWASRKRQASEKDKAASWKAKEECRFYELSSQTGETTIKNLGDVAYDLNSRRYLQEERPEADKPPVGYLNGDYSSDPPLVTLSKDVGKNSTWRIYKDPIGDAQYVANVGDSGKTAYLSMAAEATAIVPLGDEGKRVVEYRRAILSYDSKPALEIAICDDEK